MEPSFKELMDFWNNSSIYLKLQAKLLEKKDEIVNNVIKNKKLMSKNITHYINDIELEVILDNIILFDLLPEIEKEEYEWASELMASRLSKKDMYFELIKNLCNWYFHLKEKLKTENFELASKLRDVIQIEISEFKSSLSKKFTDYDEYDEAMVDEVNQTVKEQFEI